MSDSRGAKAKAPAPSPDGDADSAEQKVKAKVRTKMGALKEGAQDMADEAAEIARDAAEAQKNRVGGKASQFARALHAAAGELDQGTATRRIVDEAAGGMDDVAESIEGSSVSQLVRDLSDLGRRHPLAFLGGAALAGFALARFATASPEDEAGVETDAAEDAPEDAPENGAEDAEEEAAK